MCFEAARVSGLAVKTGNGICLEGSYLLIMLGWQTLRQTSG